MNRIQSFSKPFDAIEYRDRSKSMEKSISFSFQDREEIRRRLASDSDSEDVVSIGFRSSRKSSLISRLQSGQSLQICFLNETVNDPISRESQDSIHCHRNDNQTKRDNILDNTSHLNDLVEKEPKISPNNNSSLDITESIDSIKISNSTKRPNHLFTKLGFGSIDFEKYDLFSIIVKPSKKEQFGDYHSRLHAEARLALAQVKNIVKKQIEIERNKNRNRSSVYNLINIPNCYKLRKNKLSSSILHKLNVSQLQIIVNDMYSQIESLNTELVQLLIRRDELYMEQDSVLVDIEDLTIFLCSKQ